MTRTLAALWGRGRPLPAMEARRHGPRGAAPGPSGRLRFSLGVPRPAAGFWLVHGLLLLCLAAAPPAPAGQWLDKRLAAGDRPGSRDRDYLLYLPEAAGEAPAPLVVVLHGCRQTHRDIMEATGFNDVAEEGPFLVAYPFVTSYDGMRDRNCWGFWNEGDIREGSGEVADIARIIEAVEAAHAVDPMRIHVVGLSSGGAMAAAVMVAYSERIASGAVAAGLAYGESACAVRGVCFHFGGVRPFRPSTWFRLWEPVFQTPEETAAGMSAEMKEARQRVPVLLLHAEGDDKVVLQAARNHAAAWALLLEVDTGRPLSVETGTTEGRRWTHTRYGAGGQSAIETHFVAADFHGWIGGDKGAFADPAGPDWARIAWRFFEDHPYAAPP